MTQPNESQPSPSAQLPNLSGTPPDAVSPALHSQVTGGEGARQVAESVALAAVPGGEVSPMAGVSPNQGSEGGEGSDQGLTPGEQVVTQYVKLPPEALQALKDHSAFLHQQGMLSSITACMQSS